MLHSLLALCITLLLTPAPALAVDAEHSPLAAFGEQRFPPFYRDALQAYVDGATAYRQGDYLKAARALDALWARHPPGTKQWKQFQTSTDRLHSVADFGRPPVYSALRMLTECVQWRLEAGNAKPRNTAQLTVLLVGESQGLAPSTREELQADGGRPVVHTLAPEFQGDGVSRILNETYWLFDEYLLAITKGDLGLRRVVVRLADFRVALGVKPGSVQLSRAETDRIFAAVPKEVVRATDWWLIVYPSHVPTAPAFKGVRFATGGIRGGPPGSGAPCFVSEDLKHLRAPNQDGRRALTPLEREVALPQWLQHEFFHHLFVLYHDESLEARSHQWFDRKAWPADFEGFGEADYFTEAVHKRIWPHRLPTLSQRLRHANVKGGDAYSRGGDLEE